MIFQILLISLIGQVTSEITLWDNGVFHYNFPTTIGSQNLYDEVAGVFNQLSSQTCLQFVNESTNLDRVEFLRGSEANNYQKIQIGKLGGIQEITPGLEIGSFSRRILELLGKTPEIFRSDRNSNMPSDVNTVYLNDINITDFQPSYPFDWGSVSFQWTDFMLWTINGPNVDQYFYSTGSVKPSFYDVKYLNELYGCLDKCEQSTTVCQNGGYPNPANCDQCICPSQFEGANCEAVKDIELTATSEWQTYESTLTNDFDDTFATQKKVIWVNAPEGKTIQFAPKVVQISNASWNEQTYLNYCYPRNPTNIQFVIDTDTGLQGPKTTCNTNGLIIPSHNNPSAVILNLLGSQTSSIYSFDYRYI